MWQPHGSLLTTGAKPFETRGWATAFRGPILIHAARRFVRKEWLHYLGYGKFRAGLAPLAGLPMNFDSPPNWVGLTVRRTDLWAEVIPFESDDWVCQIPLGAFIGVGELVNCIPIEQMTDEQWKRSRGFGDFSSGRFAWEIKDVRRFKTPIPAKGRQGFFFGHVEPDRMVFA